MATRKTASTSRKETRSTQVAKRAKTKVSPPRKVAKKKSTAARKNPYLLRLAGVPALALHDVPLIDTQRMALPSGDSGERRMSVKLTYAGGAEGALLSVYIYNRAADQIEGNGISVTLDANGAGEFLAAAGSTYLIVCSFHGQYRASIKLVVSYPASVHSDEPALQLSPADTAITDPTVGFNLVQFPMPAEGGLK